MKRHTVRDSNSYWTGTLEDILRWVKEPTLNDFMRARRSAALNWLKSNPDVMLDALVNR